ncbi:MAG TPA: hypothetical protein VEL28_06850 [Candidatus Binatia bacterium]|nr:hypothetical protein [Candidatus Binatia bacterium]
MPTPDEPDNRPTAKSALFLLVTDLDRRVVRLEEDGEKSVFKRVVESTGAVALFLGLVLTGSSLYEVFVTKPQADRVERLSKFNEAINSAVQTSQELIQAQMQTQDAALRLALSNMATPRILNDVATARALLRRMEDEDVGIPQLIVLITGSFAANDLESAEDFVNRAVKKQNVSAYLQAEALRYQGKYFFSRGKTDDGRRVYRDAMLKLDGPSHGAQRAFVLSDLIAVEFNAGECAQVDATLNELATVLSGASLPMEARQQLVQGLRLHFQQSQGRCPVPARVEAVLKLLGP